MFCVNRDQLPCQACGDCLDYCCGCDTPIKNEGEAVKYHLDGPGRKPDLFCCQECLQEFLFDCDEYDRGNFDPYDPETWESEGQGASYHDPFNAYNMDGEKIGRLCTCEDYPCCGH